ncbi:MAG: MFS transporter [Flavobacteriaceae bacterium]|nr:MFS transporter [Flavobacteriaceae bacterium]
MIRTLQLILKHPTYRSIAMCFMTLNILFGTWAIYIPTLKNKLKIDEGELGVAVLFLGIGTFCMLIFAPKIIRFLHAGRSLSITMYLFFVSFIIPFVAPNYAVLCLGLFLVGVFSGLMDISMNTLVTQIEKSDNVHIMSANHGFFSLGGMISAGIGTLFMPMVSLPFWHMAVVVLVMVLVNTPNLKHFYHLKSEEVEESSFDVKLFKPLFLVIVVGFFVMSGEGAIVDWGALYLEKIAKADLNHVGYGYTFFSLFMAFGRFFGDGISQKLGSKKVILYGCLIAVLGFGLILYKIPWIAISGFGMVGLGFSTVVPELFRLGGKTPNIDAAQGISLIAGSGFIGFLIGPVLLGFLAKTWDLSISFWALLGFTVISFVAALGLKVRK